MTHSTIIRALAAAGAALAGCAAPAATQRLGPTIPMELFVGRQEFAAELRVADQDLAGVRLGVDLADFFGISGFYWRGLNEDHNGVAPLQAFGGEVQLNLNSGRGVTPFLVGGIGRVDFMEGFADLDGNQPEDRTAGIVGGGARLDLGRVGLTAAARSYLFETSDSIGDDLRSNLQLTAGLSFRLGSARSRRAAVVPPPQVVRATPDTVYVTRDGEQVRRGDDEPENFVTIPIPREGEIYLRYGSGDSSAINRRQSIEGGPLTDAQLDAVRRQVLADLEPVLRQLLAAQREALREMVREELARSGGGALSPEAEQRLVEELEARLALRLRDEVDRVEVGPDGRRHAPGFAPRLRAWRAYIGGNLDRPRQVVVGARVDLGALDVRRPALRVVPEFAVGTGAGGVSVLMAGNLQYEFPLFELSGTPVQPYAYAGAGLFYLSEPPRNRANWEAVLNFGYGASVPVPGRSGGPRLFLEHQGIDLFDLNRLLVGLRF